MRIGGWLPPVKPLAPPATAERPRPGPGTTTHVTLVREAAWMPPLKQPPLGEQPAHRRSTIGLIRSRAILFFGVAASAGIPLVLGIADAPTGLAPGAGGPPAYAQPAPDVPSIPAPRPTAPPSPDLGGPSLDPSATTSASAPGPEHIPPIWPTTPPPSTKPPAAVDISLEAEGAQAEREGDALPRALSEASGGMVVTGLGDGPANLVRFPAVTVPETGRYRVTFHYVSAQRVRARVLVNGNVNMVQFPATGDEWGRLGAVSIEVPLSAGSNTIEFGNKVDPAPDLDRMVITR
ncbi:MAG TPA: hypothetical protein VFX61_08135 [Micromonosporaceae bacterium]|nr:hypothetical protein [Micromonosporaceae bacterium]